MSARRATVPRAAWPYELTYRLGLHRLAWHTDAPPAELVTWMREGKLPGQRVLELGAGLGSTALWLARAGRDATASDFSPRAVRLAARRAADLGVRLETRLVDVTGEDSTLGPFDLVVDRECLQDLKDPADRARYAANVAKWLAPGGRLAVLTWVFEGEAAGRSFFPTARLPIDEIPRLFSSFTLEERALKRTRLYGVAGVYAAYRLRIDGGSE